MIPSVSLRISALMASLALSAVWGAGCGGGSAPSGGSASSSGSTVRVIALSTRQRLLEARAICAGLRLRISESTALRSGDLKHLLEQASTNDLIDRRALASLERVRSRSPSSQEWGSILSAAHGVEGEQAQLVALARSGNLAAVRGLERAKQARRAALSRLARAAHLASCGDFA